jgi:hypothetical protein
MMEGTVFAAFCLITTVPPAERAMEASMTRRLDALTAMLALLPARLGGVEVATFYLQSDIGEILGPVPTTTGFIQVRTFDICDSVTTPREPVKLYKFGRKFAFGHKHLNSHQQ